MNNENGYVIYPVGIGMMDLDDAKRETAKMSADDRHQNYRIENCDTEKVVARFCNGEEF